MDALKFLEEKNRMMRTDTKSYQDLKLIPSNSGLVVYVEEWSKKHPQKTRLDDFKEKYPLAKVKDENGKYNFCCSDLGYCQCKYLGDGCSQCWNEPVD